MSHDDIPPPVPPMALSYSQGGARPGLVTAIGIVSIILAAWFGLMSLFMVLHMTMMSLMGAMPMATPVAPTTAPTTLPGGPLVTMTTIDMRPQATTVIWISATTLANFILSIVLLWAGIATLARRRRGRSLHRCWSLAKIMLVPLLAYAEYLYFSGVMESVIDTMPSPQAPTQMFGAMSIAGAAFNAVFALIYPVTLLFLLRMRSIRDYFALQAT